MAACQAGGVRRLQYRRLIHAPLIICFDEPYTGVTGVRLITPREKIRHLLLLRLHLHRGLIEKKRSP